MKKEKIMKNDKNIRFANSNLERESLKTKLGFTLIELLAIIVILAIIAVITVPIILNVIDNAKKGSIIDSAYGYKDAVQKFYVEKFADDNNFKLDGIYTVNKLKNMGLGVNGAEPELNSWIFLKDNKVVDYSLKYDDYVVNYDEDTQKTVVIKGDNVKKSPIYYYGAKAKEVYFNPVDGEYCTKEDYNIANSLLKYNGTSGTKTVGEQTSCLKWYAYSETANDINMISDHNMSDNIPWITRDEFESMGGIVNYEAPACKYVGNACAETYNGPGESFKNTLYSISDTWSESLIRNDSYSVSGIKKGDKEINYTIDYKNYKARILSIEEVANISGASYPEPYGINWKLEDGDNIYFAKNRGSDQSWQGRLNVDSDNKSTNSWLYNNTSNGSSTCYRDGCDTDILVVDSNNKSVTGYWTSSSNTLKSVFKITYNGYATKDMNPPDSSGVYGLRPVITIAK